MKINTITAVFLFVCIPLSGILWIDPTGLFTITPREFSRANFSAVEVGMTKRAIRELLGEPFNELTPATIAGNIGYISPSNSYKPYLFSQKADFSQVAVEMASDIEVYGLQFAKAHSDLSALVEAMQIARFGVPEQLSYRIPVALCLLGQTEKAARFVSGKLVEIGNRTDPAAQRYIGFAHQIGQQFTFTPVNMKQP